MTLKLKDLPDVLQEAMYSIDIEDKVITIGQKNGLHLDQVADLHDIVSLVFLGDIKPQNFLKEITKQLGLTQAQADAITTEIDAQIFEPIHDALMQVQEPDKAVASPIGGTTAKPEDIERKVEIDALHEALNPHPESVQAKILEPRLEEKGQNEAKSILASGGLSPLPIPDMHEQKLMMPMQEGKKEIVIDHRPKIDLIPPELKQKINNDPYKESI